MEKEFVSYELSLALKEIGYQSPNPIGGYRGGAIFYYERSSELFYDGLPMYSSSYHEGQIIAPLYQQAFRWFREKHGYYVDLFVDDDKTFGFMISYFVEIGRADKPIQRKYNTYEEAELQCLKKLIEIAKEK
jgi:hypothetical protein